MSTRNRTPTALEPYFRLPPEQTLILLTSTLACTAHWLTVRLIGYSLNQNAQNPTSDAEEGLGKDGKETAVVLCSFTHDAAFWKADLRRGAGVDMQKMTDTGKLAWVDCFTTLSTWMQKPETVLQEIYQSITAAISKLAEQGERVLLVLDAPDLLLALALASARELQRLVLQLRCQVHSALVVCSADLPLLGAAAFAISGEVGEKITPVEAETAAFIVLLAHAARVVMSVRELDTGAAKDVSGVLRVTRGGAAYDWGDGEREGTEVGEMEVLYLVQRDGSAKVFERGNAG